MARENRLLKNSAKPAINDFLNAVGEKKLKATRSKIFSISFYDIDAPVLLALSRYIQDQTGRINVSNSSIYRAALHCVQKDKKFLEAFEMVEK